MGNEGGPLTCWSPFLATKSDHLIGWSHSPWWAMRLTIWVQLSLVSHSAVTMVATFCLICWPMVSGIWASRDDPFSSLFWRADLAVRDDPITQICISLLMVSKVHITCDDPLFSFEFGEWTWLSIMTHLDRYVIFWLLVSKYRTTCDDPISFDYWRAEPAVCDDPFLKVCIFWRLVSEFHTACDDPAFTRHWGAGLPSRYDPSAPFFEDTAFVKTLLSYIHAWQRNLQEMIEMFFNIYLHILDVLFCLALSIALALAFALYVVHDCFHPFVGSLYSSFECPAVGFDLVDYFDLCLFSLVQMTIFVAMI